jgi:hypothetical protein
MTGQNLGGQTLAPGVYCFATSAPLSASTLTLDGRGDSQAKFVFNVAANLTTSATSVVRLINGANACNVFWQVASSATLGGNSQFSGNLAALGNVTASLGASVNGRLISLNGAVALERNRVDTSSCGC